MELQIRFLIQIFVIELSDKLLIYENNRTKQNGD